MSLQLSVMSMETAESQNLPLTQVFSIDRGKTMIAGQMYPLSNFTGSHCVFYLLINDCGIYCLLRQHIYMWSFSTCLCNQLHSNQTPNKNNKKSSLPALVNRTPEGDFAVDKKTASTTKSLSIVSSLQQDSGSAVIIRVNEIFNSRGPF